MKLQEAQEKFISAWGAFGAQWGINRTMAQIHALLLVSESSLSTEDIMKDLVKAGLVRRTVAQVWNKGNFRLTSNFEYENENAYKKCQKIIKEKVLPKANQSYTIKSRNNRGIIIYDFRA